MENPASQQDDSLTTLNLLSSLGNWLNHLRAKSRKHTPSWDLRLGEISRTKLSIPFFPSPLITVCTQQLQSQAVETGCSSQGMARSKQAADLPAGGHQPQGKGDLCCHLSRTKKWKFYSSNVSINPIHHLTLQRPKIIFILRSSKLEINKNASKWNIKKKIGECCTTRKSNT